MSFDDGGTVDPSQMGGVGGFTPSAQTSNPVVQGFIQRYASMPTEQLQELSSRLGGTSQGQIVQQILQKRRTMPNANNPVSTSTAAAPTSPLAPSPNPVPPMSPVPGQKRGGAVRRAVGGATEADPWWSRSAARSEVGRATTFLSGSTPGRADAVSAQAPAGSYIVPADVVAGLGEGNSMAGARVVDDMMHSLPYGIEGTQQRGGRGLPRAPASPQMQAKGGETKPNGGGAMVPVMLSDGEVAIHPHYVWRVGKGDISFGHKVLNDWVVKQRKKHIAKLQKLPGPVKT